MVLAVVLWVVVVSVVVMAVVVVVVVVVEEVVGVPELGARPLGVEREPQWSGRAGRPGFHLGALILVVVGSVAGAVSGWRRVWARLAGGWSVSVGGG